MCPPPSAPSDSSDNKRRNKRAPVFQPAVAEFGDGQDVLCEIRDFCRSGVFLKIDGSVYESATAADLLGKTIDLQFAPPQLGGRAPIRVSGVIARLTDAGIGVAFTRPEPEVVAVLGEVARHIAKNSKQKVQDSPRKDSANHAAIERTCRAALAECLPVILRLFNKNIEQALLEAAAEAKTSHEQTAYFDGITICKNLAELGGKFRALAMERAMEYSVVDRMDAAPGTDYQLSLVDPEEFEDWLNLVSEASKLESLFQTELDTLRARLELIAPVPIDAKNNPYGPKALSSAFADAFDRSLLQNEAKKVIYRVFGRSMQEALQGLYRQLGEITAPLESANRLRRPPKREPPKAPAPKPEADVQAAPQPPAPANKPDPDRLAPNISGFGIPRVGAVATFAALRALAQSHSGRVAPIASTASRPAGFPIGPVRPATDDENAPEPPVDSVRFAGTVLDSILENPGVAVGLKPFFQQWRQPLSHFAAQDPGMMDHQSHPARRFLDALDEVSLAADDKGMINARLQDKLDWLIRRLSAEGRRNPMLLNQGTAALKNLTRLLRRLRERRLESLREEYEANERRSRARRAVEAEVARLLAGRKVPKIIPELLDTGWRQWLILEHMRQGPLGEDWGKGLAILEMLLDWLQPGRPDPTAADVFALVDFLDRQLALACPDAGHKQRLIDEVSALLLSPRKAPEWVELPPSEHAEESVEIKNPLSYWLRNYHEGDWLRFALPDAPAVAARLSWKANDNGRFLFTNIKGAKQYDLKAHEFAKLLELGQAARIEPQDMPLTERTVNALMQSLLDQLKHQATHDEVTGLLNSRAFRYELARFLRAGPVGDYVLCVMEIDQLRLINNRCGLDAGEGLLRDIAAGVNKELRPTERAARLSDNQFVVLFEGHVTGNGYAKAQHFLDTVRSHNFKWEDESFQLGANLGLVPVSEHADSAAELLKNADTACLKAKESGLNRIKVYEVNDDQSLTEQKVLMGWAERIDNILISKENRLFPRCQLITPITDSIPDTEMHYEVLLGVFTEDGTEEPPADLVRAAERWKRAVEIDMWQVESVFNWIRRTPEKFANIAGLAINLSGQSFSSPEFRGFLTNALRTAEWPLDKLVFEITETAAIAELDQAESFLRQIRRFGCRVALDDFGSGISSYTYLKTLRADYLKIDGSFIREMPDSYSDYAIVKSMNEIAHSLGMKTIAEHVESPETLEKLREIGVDYAQGFLISRPFPLSDLL